ncbi:hypothetical protein SAMN04515647_4516 [Cohaesibacter sp. ES.047]|uniref:hypothetical protein n=1 Tax=Cohaesibacter sp. ES.047 TaxID=1798205 RepID=UPI000BBFD873|nr:hypothetical protein [Cohaesibacter sp. ES.047]SNY94193.1 hypothetical protein SAMN04515647_4516 [Cohaesibacter sp. ES.047]
MMNEAEIEKLLPWYSKGLLERDQTEQVDAYLKANPEMQMQLDLIAEEADAVERIHASLGAPKPGGLDRLMADIDAIEAEKAPVSNTANSLADKCKAFFDNFSSPGMRIAAMAAALVVVIQGVIIGGLIEGGQKANVPGSVSSRFTTASGPAEAVRVDGGAVFLVSFRKDARIDAVAALLKTQSARIISGPKAGGFFELQVPSDKLPDGGAKAVVDALKAETDLVQFASVSE